MRMYDLIEKKKKGKELSSEEIKWFVKNYASDSIPEYQVSAFMMAIYFRGMSKEETNTFTLAVAQSGDMLDLKDINGIKVDKHSTGGVGDKTSLVVAPMVSALGVPVAKMSGRGLGHTGGTIDKLESIEGFSCSLDNDTFIKNVNNIKIAIAGQTATLAPVDKKLYALRDVTATVDQVSLIAASIMSKKIASGADAIVLDVKTGSGAFMRQEEDAIELAQIMVDIGNGLGRKTTAIISDMNQPLGKAVGNSLEVIEAIETLKGNGPKDLLELALELGSVMVVYAKKADTLEEAKEKLLETIENGSALNQLKKLVEYQGGNVKYIDDYSLFTQAKYIEEIKAPISGYVKSIETMEIGVAAMMLGGGRETKDSIINLSVGFIIEKKVGDFVHEGDCIAKIYGDDIDKITNASNRFINAYSFATDKVEYLNMIKKIVK